MTLTNAGRVTSLFRYPVKSMAAEPLESVDVGWYGFAGDRRWAFVREGTERSGFPWLTIRERPEMWHYAPHFIDADKPDSSVTMVRTPSGDDLDVVSGELAAELGHGARVIKQGRGIFDAFPLSLITTETVSRLGSMAGADLDIRRFRPNLVVDAAGDAAFTEDEWVGCVIHMGAMAMRVDKRDKRCVLINVDPETSAKNPAVLRAVAQERDAHLGVYGSVVKPGRMTVGDAVLVER